jgi:betaine-aldehyde dehydrogenase
MKAFQNFVNGSYVDAADGRTSAVINPATRKQYATAPISGDADVDAAMQAAAAAFPGWRDSTPSERSLALLRIADAVEARAEDLIALEVENCGKPAHLVRGEEIPPMVDQIRFFATAARHLEGKSAGEYMRGMTSFIRREPVGVCAQVAPWNYPMMMAVWKFAPAIAAGNAVVLKPSDTTPASTALLAEIAAEFLPQGVFNVICGDRDTGRSMIVHDIPAMASVTGSVRAGMEVASAASQTLKRVHLELGGKAPVVVFDDADIESLIETLAEGSYYNSGQDCTAPCRVITGPGVFDDFVAGFTDAVGKINVGDPFDPDVFMGPLVSADQQARVEGMVDRAVAAGAEVTVGGKKGSGTGYYYDPSVVVNPAQDSEIVQREVFGPVVTVQRFADEDQALAWANGVDYGLSASVWTKDVGRAMRMTRAMQFGCVWVNDHIMITSEMPHGGFKQSGYGKDMSIYALEHYTDLKHVMIKH